ncbi:hypothetical protein JCM11641_004533 [Rhodosporidiobolus odoratus]
MQEAVRPPVSNLPPRLSAIPIRPTSPPSDVRTRRIVIIAFWSVILLGVPLWWRTTTLERRPLPVARIREWQEEWQQRILPDSSQQALPASVEPDARAVKFSPRYKLVFSLLNEDSAAGGAVLDWDLPALIDSRLRPFLSSLAPLYDFTIESQVQYFAPLAVPLHEDAAREGTFVKEEDLRAFVNNAEWNLGSGATFDPVLYFLMFVPSLQHRPLRIRRTDGRDATPAFLSPQRGGVVILNPPSTTTETLPSASLDLGVSTYTPSFALIEQHLRSLLGVPPGPSAGALSSDRLDHLVQSRLREAARDSVDSLTAIAKLAADIPNMRIGKEVQSRVKEALDELEKAAASSVYLPSEALAHVARAQTLASQAYFDPSMLALLYFPDEHKYAVYTPLFGPIAVPLLVALLREVKEWKKGRKTSASVGEEEKVGEEVKEKGD